MIDMAGRSQQEERSDLAPGESDKASEQVSTLIKQLIHSGWLKITHWGGGFSGVGEHLGS